MDIAIISEHASPIGALGGKDAGGQNVYVAQLATHLARLGHRVEVFTRRDATVSPIVQDLKEGFRLVNVPAGPSREVPKEKLLPYMSDFTKFMLRYIRTRGKKFDVIHSNFWMSGLVAADIKKALDIPFLITFHALGRVRRIHQGTKDGFPDERFEIEDRVVAEADGIIAECPQDLDDLVSLYNAPISSIKVIPCGYDPLEMQPMDKLQARRKLGLPPEDEVILHLGRMVPRKGADNIIRGFARYVKENKKNSKLIIVGGESDKPDPRKTPEIGRLMQIAQQEMVSDQVLFAGRCSRKNLKIYYSAADVFVTTPWYEPFGITPVEAMACGTPVIGAAVGGIKYTVKHGETGFLVPPNDPIALCQELSQLMSNAELKLKFAKNSIVRAHGEFRWELMCEQVEKFLETRMKRIKVATTVDSAIYPIIQPLNSNVYL
jgi:D-inositol-3-phosphate glycosyltransferase